MSAKSKKSTTAGGFPAIGATLHHLRRETGLVRGTKLLLNVNQDKGFDCPGCAWPEPKKRSMFEFCENGAKAVAEEATKKKATEKTFAAHTIAELRSMSDFELGQLGRLTQPMIAEEGAKNFVPISWEDAYSRVAKKVKATADADRLVFYASGRTSNEAAFLYQLLARSLGTNNLPDCSNMCHESSGYGLKKSIGVGKGTVGLDDFERADLIVVVGQNPGTNHPRMLSALREAVKRGCRVVSVNPLREVGLFRFSHPQKPIDLMKGGVSLASLHLPVRIGADVALFQGISKLLLKKEREEGNVLDHEFIEKYTGGFRAFEAHINKISLDDVAEKTGINKNLLRQFADIYASSERVITCWAMGLTQHENAVANIQEIVNLMLLRGNVGRPGAGLCPVRGHSNVQGDRTVGITSQPAEQFLASLETEFSTPMPRESGLDTLASIEAMEANKVDMLVAMGGNLHSATPDTRAVEKAMANVSLGVHITTKINQSHLHGGKTKILLPCLGRTERDERDGVARRVTVEDSMSMVHASQGRIPPASSMLRSEVEIVAGIASTIEAESNIPWNEFGQSYKKIRESLGRVLPAFAGINEVIDRGESIRLPNGARERKFETASGKAEFTVHPSPELTLKPGEFRMMTIRSHDQYNTTIYGFNDRYRGVKGERFAVFMNPSDLEELQVGEGRRVDLRSEYDGVMREVKGFTVFAYDIPRRCIATYFPEANPLVPLSRFAKHSRTPISKSVLVRVTRSAN